jgi:DNA-binding response OmpR family regulator
MYTSHATHECGLVFTERERALSERLDEANETILQLRGTLRPTEWALYHGVRFTRTESSLLDAMRCGDVYSLDYLVARMGAITPSGRASVASLRVVICRLRKKLARLNVTIENQHGVGHFMSSASIATLDALRLPPSRPSRADHTGLRAAWRRSAI